MRFWRNLLGGLILWAAHFFAIYGIASILSGTQAAVVLAILVTGLALAVTAWLFAKTASSLRGASDDIQRWSSRLSLLGYVLAGAAIAYQGLAAAFS